MQDKTIKKYSMYISYNIDKLCLFNIISQFSFKKGYSKNSNLIYSLLKKREALGSTLIYEGVTLPHFQSDKIDDSFLVLAIIKHGIKNWSYNSDTIYVVVFIILKEKEDKQILNSVKLIVKKLANEVVINKLKLINSEEELSEYIKIF